MINQEGIINTIKLEYNDCISIIVKYLDDPIQKLLYEINKATSSKNTFIQLAYTYNNLIFRIKSNIKNINNTDNDLLTKHKNILMLYRHSKYLSRRLKIHILELLELSYSLLSFQTFFNSKYIELKDKVIFRKLELL